MVLATTMAHAQRVQDFASKYVDMCKNDTAVHCVTVSPKMMEQLLQTVDNTTNENLMEAMAKLKSLRIVTIAEKDRDHYERAEQLLKKNARRFRPDKSYQAEQTQGAFYTRTDKNGNPVELVMICNNAANGKTIIVNLTGTIDKEFTQSLMRHFEKKR